MFKRANRTFYDSQYHHYLSIQPLESLPQIALHYRGKYKSPQYQQLS